MSNFFQILVASGNSYNNGIVTIQKPLISFVFDDARDTDPLVLSIFNEYGFKVTFALMTNVLTESKDAFYQSAYAEGHGILAHSVSHMDMSSSGKDTQVRAEMESSKSYIEALGIPIRGWATPYSVLHPSYLYLTEELFDYAYTTDNTGFTKDVPVNTLQRYGIEANRLQGTLDQIDLAIANNLYVTFYGHEIPSSYTGFFSEADLRATLDYVQIKVNAGELDIKTTDEAYEILYN